MDRKKWVLGEDISVQDNILDPVTFQDLILAVHCNCQKITPDAVKKEMKQIVEMRIEDTMFLIEKNMQAIMDSAMEGRS